MNESSSFRWKFPGRCEVDSVQRWLLDIRGMTEPECDSVLETKPIHNSPLNVENLAATAKENIYRIQSIADGIYSDLSLLFTKLKMGATDQVRPLVLSLNVRTRSCLVECSQLCPDLTHLEQVQKEIFEEMGSLVKCFEMYQSLSDMSTELFLRSLTSLGKAVKSHLESVQSAQIRKLVGMIQDSASELNVKFAVVTVHCLAQDSVWLRRLIIQEDTLGALFAICRISKFTIQSIPVTALQVISTLCTETEGRAELEKVGGVGALGEMLASPITNECVKREAASVLAEITSPSENNFHRMLCFIEHMEDLLRSLTALCDQTSSPTVFLVAASAIANITFMDPMSYDYLMEFETATVLIQGYLKGKAPSIYSKHQIVTIIANLSGTKACRDQILAAGGMHLMAELLQARAPSTSSPITKQLGFYTSLEDADGLIQSPERFSDGCEDLGLSIVKAGPEERSFVDPEVVVRGSVSAFGTSYEDNYQKAAIAVGRLCQDYETCKMAVDLKMVQRLADLCKHSRERNHNEAVLVACLAALRRIHSHIGSSPLKENDVKQLIQPRLIDSFLHCSGSSRQETLV